MGVFRDRRTGFECVNQKCINDYIRSVKDYMKKNGVPDAKYINSLNDHFELMEEIEYKPNRLVLYPGNLLYSGLVDPARDIDGDPNTGRLTANLFMDFDRS